VCNHWSVPDPPADRPVPIATHCVTDMSTVSGSRLVPLMRQIKPAAAQSESDTKQEAFRQLLTRLISEIDVLSVEYATKMMEKSSRTSSRTTPKMHHADLPSNAMATQMTNAAFLDERATAYIDGTIRPRLEEMERRDARAAEIVMELGAAGAVLSLGGGAVDSDVVTASAGVSEALSQLAQLQAEATRLMALAIQSYQSTSERPEAVRQRLQDALEAKQAANAQALRLEGDVKSGMIGTTTARDVAETIESTGFDTSTSPATLLSKLHSVSASGGRQSVRLASLVKRSDRLSPGVKEQAESALKDDVAMRADAASLAAGRAARRRKSQAYPTGSVEYAAVMPDGAAASALEGVGVWYQQTDGGEWRRGKVNKYYSHLRKYRLVLDRPPSDRSRKPVYKDVKLPDPRCRFFRVSADTDPAQEGAGAPLQSRQAQGRRTPASTAKPGASRSQPSSSAPAPLAEERASTAYGLLERGASTREAGASAVAACLQAPSAEDLRAAAAATADPPTTAMPTEDLVGADVLYTTETPNGEYVELEATVQSLDPPSETGLVLMAHIRVGNATTTRHVPMAALRYTGFLAQTVRRWGSEEIVRREDARRLRPPPEGHRRGRGCVPAAELRNYWLNTTAVNCLGRVISTHFPSTQVLPMQLGEHALRADFARRHGTTKRLVEGLLASSRTQLFADGVEHWLLPCCRRGHIFGVCVHFPLKLIFVIDSMGGEQKEPTDARRAAQLLTHEVHAIAGMGVFDWTEWKVTSLGRLAPSQEDSFVDCGVMLMASCWALAAGVPLACIRHAEVLLWRQRFLVWLTQGPGRLSPQD